MPVEVFVPPPRSVSRARWLLLGCAALAALDGVAAVAARRQLNAVAASFGDLESAAAVSREANQLLEISMRLAYNLVVGAGTAAVLLPLGLLVLRRWQAVRAAVLVAALLACAAFGIGLAAGPEALILSSGVDSDNVRQALERMTWYPILHSFVAFGFAAGMVTVVLLMLRSSTRDYYYRPDPTQGPGLWTFASDRDVA
jgi:hypothetical protein